MNLEDYVIDEYDPNKGRNLRKGHSVQKSADGSRLLCTCGWFIRFVPTTDKEVTEELAWLHISKPSYVIAGSSDVEHFGRMRRLELPRSLDR